MINVQSKDIKTEFGWKPDSNTVMYFPFTTDQLDKIGNCSLPVPGTKQTLGYRFSSGPGSQQNYTNPPSNMVFVSFRIKVNALKSSSQYPHVQTPNTAIGNINYSFEHDSSSSPNEYYRRFAIITSYSGGTSKWKGFGNIYNYQMNKRIHFAYGWDGTKAFGFINGVKYGEMTTTAGRPGYAGFIRNIDADYSELIGQKVCWSEQEIINYFNKTKSKYGL